MSGKAGLWLVWATGSPDKMTPIYLTITWYNNFWNPKMDFHIVKNHRILWQTVNMTLLPIPKGVIISGLPCIIIPTFGRSLLTANWTTEMSKFRFHLTAAADAATVSVAAAAVNEREWARASFVFLRLTEWKGSSEQLWPFFGCCAADSQADISCTTTARLFFFPLLGKKSSAKNKLGFL